MEENKERMDWNKFVKVFTLDVDVSVKKEVTRADVILSLLNDNEIAFKGKTGGTFVIKTNDDWSIDVINTLVIKPILKDIGKEKEFVDKDNLIEMLQKQVADCNDGLLKYERKIKSWRNSQ